MDSFGGRTVVLTGAAGSIGRPLCLAFARAGANVVVNDLGGSVTGDGESTDPAAKVVQYLQSQGYKNVVADFHDVREGEKIVKTAVKAFGRIDVIINNAGIMKYGYSEDHSMDYFRKAMEVNAMGPISIIKTAWPHFKSQNYGRVVNFTSDTIFGVDICAPYEISKTAVFGITKAFAAEGKKFGILVNAVAPTSLSRMTEDAIKDENMATFFQKTYTGEGNIVPILALAHENNVFNGQIFSVGAERVAKFELGVRRMVHNVTTIEKFLSAMTEKDNEHSPISVPEEMYALMSWKVQQMEV